MAQKREKPTLHKNFCANVRARRLQLKLTQLEVARLLDVSQPSYAKIEYGTNIPTLAVVERVAKVLRVPASKLISLPRN